MKEEVGLLAARDFSAALDQVRRLVAEEQLNTLYAEELFVAALGRGIPAEAKEVLRSVLRLNADGNICRAAADRVCRLAAARDPDVYLRFVLDGDAGFLKAFTSTAAYNATSETLEYAANRVLSGDCPECRLDVLGGLGAKLGSQLGDVEFYDWILGNFSENGDQRELISSGAIEMAEHDPWAAARLLMRLPDNEREPESWCSVVGHLMRDPSRQDIDELIRLRGGSWVPTNTHDPVVMLLDAWAERTPAILENFPRYVPKELPPVDEAE